MTALVLVKIAVTFPNEVPNTARRTTLRVVRAVVVGLSVVVVSLRGAGVDVGSVCRVLPGTVGSVRSFPLETTGVELLGVGGLLLALSPEIRGVELLTATSVGVPKRTELEPTDTELETTVDDDGGLAADVDAPAPAAPLV